MGYLLVALYLGFFGVLSAGAIGLQIYGLSGRAERRARRDP